MRIAESDDRLAYQFVDASGGRDGIRLQGFKNCSAHQCTVIAIPTGADGEATKAHWDGIQLISTDDSMANAQYALAVMSDFCISACSVHAPGLPVQVIFSSDGLYQRGTIVDCVGSSDSAHKISIRGFLSGSIVGNVNADGEPLPVALRNARIGGRAGQVGDDVHVLDTIQVQVLGFESTDYAIQPAHEICPDGTHVEDLRGIVTNDRDVFMDRFDRDGFFQAARLIDVSDYPEQYRTAGFCRELKRLAVSGEFGQIVSCGWYDN